MTFVEIPAGATGTILASGKSFQFGEDEITALDSVDTGRALILGGTVSVPLPQVKVIP